MVSVKNPTRTVTSPRPKIDPLRPFSAALTPASQRIVIPAQRSRTVSITLADQEQREVQVEVQDHALLNLVLELQAPDEQQSKLILTTTIATGGRLAFFPLISGGSRIEVEARIVLKGQTSEADVFGAFHARGEQQHGFHVVLDHHAPNTKGNILLRGVYEDRGRGIFTALIKVEKIAQKTNSYFRDDVLLLDEAIAESLPTLEIEANDVKASHGSTTSRLNDDQLFYLRSRGLPPELARQLIIEGFLGTVRLRVPTAELNQTNERYA